MVGGDDVIQLVTETKAQDAYGVWNEVETLRQVFCRVSSVTASEFFEAGRNGLNPEYQFIVFADDYNGEDTIVYKNKRYGIYRTFLSGDYIELYVQRKGGTNA